MLEHPPYEEVEILYVHPKVDLADLKEDNKILTVDQINLIKGYLKGKENGRYEKKDLRNVAGLTDLPFGIVKSGEDYHAVYRGKGDSEEESKVLGSGGFGSVKLTQNLATGEWGVIKIMTTSAYLTSEQIKTVAEDETKALEKTGQLAVAAYQREKKPTQFEVLMTLSKGVDLARFVQSGRDMPTRRWLDMAANMAQAVKTVHDANILHRDIKPENMIYDATTGKISLVDFGLAVIVQPGIPVIARPGMGTFGYMSPEIQSRKGTNVTYDNKVDVYALGIAIAGVLGLIESQGDYRLLVFQNQEAFIHNKQLKDLSEQEKINVWTTLDEMTRVDSKKRPSADKAFEFFNNLCQKHLQALTTQRRMGYLTIEDYLKSASNPKDKKDMLEALRSMDQVCLIDKNNTHKDSYIALKRSLQQEGILVNNKVIQHPESNLDSVLSSHARKKSSEDQLVYECHRIAYGQPPIPVKLANLSLDRNSLNEARAQQKTPTPLPPTLGEPKNTVYETTVGSRVVPDEQKEIVRRSLNSDVHRLEKQMLTMLPGKKKEALQARLNLIANSVPDTQAKGITYEGLHARLSALEKQLTLDVRLNARVTPEKRSIKDKMKVFFEEHLGLFASTSRKTVLTEIKNLDREVKEVAKKGNSQERDKPPSNKPHL